MNFEFLLLIIFFLFLATWAFIALVIYYIPVVIAFIRKHNNIFAIAILTTMLGWTFFGWLASLLWALNSDIKEQD